MTKMRVLGVFGLTIVGGLLCIIACGPAASTAPTKWQGATDHARIVGTLNGESIDVDISGANATDTSKLWCEREYQVHTDDAGVMQYAQGRNSEFRVRMGVTMDGGMRNLDVEFKQHNFEKDTAGTAVTVIPRDDLNPPPDGSGKMWLAIAYFDPTLANQLYKQAAQSGTYTTGEFTGMPDSTGLLYVENNGEVGGFFTARWSSTEQVVGSFSAKCTTDDIDNN